MPRKERHQIRQRFTNRYTASNKDTRKLGKHAQCWNTLKIRLSLIAQSIKKATKQNTEQYTTWTKQCSGFP